MLHSNRRGLAVTTLLAWVASCEGTLTPTQYQLLREFTNSQNDSEILELALQAVQKIKLSDLLMACNVVRNLPHKGKTTFLMWAFTVADVEDPMAISTNYILRFFAELTNISIEDACRQSQKKLPEPADPSSVKWWRANHGGKKRKKKKK